jgi:hypothetical protein
MNRAAVMAVRSGLFYWCVWCLAKKSRMTSVASTVLVT